MTYLIYHSSAFFSIANALQPGGINPCFSVFQKVEADRSGIFPTGFSQCSLYSDLQLPASCAGAVAGGGLFGAPSAGPGLPAVASPFCPAMAGRPSYMRLQGLSWAAKNTFTLLGVAVWGVQVGQLPPGSWRWLRSGLGLALGRWLRGRVRV